MKSLQMILDWPINKLDWIVYTCLTQLYGGRNMYIYPISSTGKSTLYEHVPYNQLTQNTQ